MDVLGVVVTTTPARSGDRARHLRVEWHTQRCLCFSPGPPHAPKSGQSRRGHAQTAPGPVPVVRARGGSRQSVARPGFHSLGWGEPGRLYTVGQSRQVLAGAWLVEAAPIARPPD